MSCPPLKKPTPPAGPPPAAAVAAVVCREQFAASAAKWGTPDPHCATTLNDATGKSDRGCGWGQLRRPPWRGSLSSEACAEQPNVLDKWIAQEFVEYVSKPAVAMASSRCRLASPKRPPRRDRNFQYEVSVGDSAVADVGDSAVADCQEEVLDLELYEAAKAALADKKARIRRSGWDVGKAMLDEDMAMFKFTVTLPKVDNIEPWIKLKDRHGYVQVPKQIVKWKPGWVRQWGYVKTEPAVAELSEWTELVDQQGWVRMPPTSLSHPMDAKLPLPLSSINMPAAAKPLTVIVAHPDCSMRNELSAASWSAVAVTMAAGEAEWNNSSPMSVRNGERVIQPSGDELYVDEDFLRPTVVVPGAIFHDAGIVWDRRWWGSGGYRLTAFGVQIEFAQWLGCYPRLRVAILTMNLSTVSTVGEDESEELARCLVLGGFQLVICFSNASSDDPGVIVPASELMYDIARCGVHPILLQEEMHQVVFRMRFPGSLSAVAGGDSSSAVADRDADLVLPAYTEIEPDLLTFLQREVLATVAHNFCSFTPRKWKPWCRKAGTLVVVGVQTTKGRSDDAYDRRLKRWRQGRY